ncbi:hypothetical protein RBE51_21045 [Pseudomonas taiwanensis]|uniref:hypothetical protein n=1 Tax=Pseudomonas taiwanensis TaxID=470150 RepID=UPI0028E08C16|nr:hypothetical protein [Pseudomonas taiwanensis]MDT8925284.1 hypothetical protein [Pseudomonas taiwanensis]
MSQLFKNGQTFELTAEREALFERFASGVLAFAEISGYECESAEEVCAEHTHIFRAFVESDEGRELLSQIHAGGALDFFTLYVNDASPYDMKDEWLEYESPFSFADLREDIDNHGLHSLHFRMNLTDEEGRKWGVTTISRQLHDYFGDTCPNDLAFPLHSLSSLIKEDYDHELKLATYAVRDIEGDDTDHEFTKSELNALLNLFARVDFEPEQANALDTGMAKFMSGRGQYEMEIAANTLPRHLLADQVEQGLLAMVYNYGYRLKATMPISNFDLKEEVSPVIDHLLAQFKSTPEFTAALKRQVMINLFSAFPRGLEMFGTKPEELQGVILDPVLKSHPDAQYFLKTLMGPVALFRADKSATEESKASSVIDYLTAAGYPITVETASQGLLFDRPEFSALIHHEGGESAVLDAYLAEDRSADKMPRHVIKALMRPEYLRSYSDRAALNILRTGLNLRAAEVNQDRLLKLHLKGLFDQRPGLVEPVLDHLWKNDLLTPKVFQELGFDHKELRLLGSRAPDSLAEHVLGGDLGL